MIGSLNLKWAMSAQEWRNNELASINSQLWKQIAEVQTRESNLKVKNVELVAKLAIVQATVTVSERESALRLERMKTIMGYDILHARAMLMLEYKEGHNVEWDLNHEIEI